jgi:YD repeat-containing protein
MMPIAHVDVFSDHQSLVTPFTVRYTYDGAGNRLSLATDDGLPRTDYTYDALNRLTAISSQQAAISQFTYDALSRRTTLALANGTTTSSTYDMANRLLTLTSPLTPLTYTYDPLGNRQTMTDSLGLHTLHH